MCGRVLSSGVGHGLQVRLLRTDRLGRKRRPNVPDERAELVLGRVGGIAAEGSLEAFVRTAHLIMRNVRAAQSDTAPSEISCRSLANARAWSALTAPGRFCSTSATSSIVRSARIRRIKTWR